jgi:predicted DNA-binding protein YlxM (UPF0122 family)
MAEDWKAAAITILLAYNPDLSRRAIAKHFDLKRGAVQNAVTRAHARFPQLDCLLGVNRKQARAQQQRRFRERAVARTSTPPIGSSQKRRSQ